jgi:hypothetical protein
MNLFGGVPIQENRVVLSQEWPIQTREVLEKPLRILWLMRGEEKEQLQEDGKELK